MFDASFFAANYNLKSRSEAQTKQRWRSELAGATFPHCKQAVASFSPNAYYRANKGAMGAMATGGAIKCGRIVEHYLTTGIYNGLKSYDARKEQEASRGVASQSKRVDALRGDTAALLLKTTQGKTEWRLDTAAGSAPF